MARIRYSMKRKHTDTPNDTRSLEPLAKFAMPGHFCTAAEVALWKLENGNPHSYLTARAQYMEAKPLGLLARRIYFETGSLCGMYARLAEMRITAPPEPAVWYEETRCGFLEVQNMPSVTVPEPESFVVRPSVIRVFRDGL